MANRFKWWGGLFLYLNSDKEGITLNLDEPVDQALLRDLAQRADILVTNAPPGYMQDRGLGFQAISTMNNRLIYASIRAFGASGPYANYLGYDLHMWHGSGAAHRFLGEPDREPSRGAWNMASHWALCELLGIEETEFLELKERGILT